MRRRLALLMTAAMAMVLLAFVVPLAVVVRLVIADRALANATDVVRSVSAQVALDPRVPAVQQAVMTADRPVTVLLPGRPPLGPKVSRGSPSVRLAERGQSITVSEPAGQEILFAVQGLPHGGTAVVRTFVSNGELAKGVPQAWAVLGVLGVILLGLGVAVADRLVGTVTRPIGELAKVSHVLAAGDLDVRARLDGPPEVVEVAHGLNHLAGRIRDLIWQERESIADLSHRLRTPLTALRLEAEALPDGADPDGRLLGQVQALEDAVTSLIEDARTRGSTPGSCDAVQEVTQRAEFWAVLARDQGRDMTVDAPAGPLPVGVAAAEFGACLDALLGNVFAHTPQGASFAVRLRPRGGGGAVLSVDDTGPGFPPGDLVRRGSSGGGSTGLGLDIARQTAESSGGTLTIKNSGEGGQVVVELGPPQTLRPR